VGRAEIYSLNKYSQVWFANDAKVGFIISKFFFCLLSGIFFLNLAATAKNVANL
jgi:hypothetical protein